MLSRLRHVLGDGVLRGRSQPQLVLPARARIDVEIAVKAIHEAETAAATSARERASTTARAALNVARREFLVGFEAPWIEERRQFLQTVKASALECVGEAGLGLGGSEIAAAERSGRALSAIEPYRESGYRLLMRALKARGNAAAALAVSIRAPWDGDERRREHEELVASGYRDRSVAGVQRSFVARMSTVILRGGVEVENPLELALEFLEAYSSFEACDSSRPGSFDERDLRLANRGGARISAAEIAATLERRGEIERALRTIQPDASLADATSSIPWIALTRLFDAFADIRGIGFSKMTKALHRKRPALIPMLDSVVQAYLTKDDSGTPSSGTFGERAVTLVRSYKRDLDRNRSALVEIQQELASHEYRLTEVRILDLLIWSV